MNHLRDTLLSPSPQGLDEIQGDDGIAHDREDVRKSIVRGEFQELRGAAFYNRTWIITERYCNSGDGVDSLVGYIHHIWYTYYQLSRHTSHETADHNSLVLDIIRIQGQGPLSRPVRGNYGIDIARTVEGTLWNDLPFLVTDMTEVWMTDFATMAGTQRVNFASFLAKLASTRVSKDRMCVIAILIFRYTFETPQEVYPFDEPDDEDLGRSLKDLQVQHLLPSVFTWIKEAGKNLLLLSEVSWNDCPSAIGNHGPLLIESEFGKRSSTGLTPWRWMFWLKRLHEFRDQAKKVGEKRVEELCDDSISQMFSDVKDRNSEVLRAYKAGGEGIQKESHLTRLKKILDGEDSDDGEIFEDDEDNNGS
ncbi:hypothetical protein N7481_006711 [Penicillium waksmanii]|uniref:uncharacterized protein n=1 Tax=Penicillium waksmanii TaxID=69791 RepID=UPI00254959BF|nr:uncharacterized protein N7481_006711 [Penicillium waksmanii]KAJ5984612.1 hypothetical protein N7481_006711 [Penicillium waksmanii]